jgi:thymidine phosphorylase
MLIAGGDETELPAARARARRALNGGGALERFGRLIAAQGGDPSVAERPERLPAAPETAVFRAPRGATVKAIQPTVLGYGVIELGGGRKRLGERIDPAVGFVLHATVDQSVAAGEPLATVHAATPDQARSGVETLGRAFVLGEPGEKSIGLRPLISHRVLEGGVSRWQED